VKAIFIIGNITCNVTNDYIPEIICKLEKLAYSRSAFDSPIVKKSKEKKRK